MGRWTVGVYDSAGVYLTSVDVLEAGCSRRQDYAKPQGRESVKPAFTNPQRAFSFDQATLG